MKVIYLILFCAAFAKPAPARADFPSAPPIAGPESFDALWDFSNPRESEKRLRAQMIDAHGHGPSWILQLQTQIARAMGLQKKYAKAEKLLGELETPAKEDAPSTVRLLLEKGRLLVGQGSRERARALFALAAKIAEGHDLSFFVVDADRMQAASEKNSAAKGPWLEKALAVVKNSKDPAGARWLGYLYDHLGWYASEEEHFSDALKSFRLAAVEMEKQGDLESARHERWAAAKMLRLVARPNEALREQQKLESEYSREGKTDGFVGEELAELFLALKNPERSQTYARSAYELLTSQGELHGASVEKSRLAELAGLPKSTAPASSLAKPAKSP